MLLFATALALLLADPDGQTPADPVCTARPTACRVVPPFELRLGDRVNPIAPTGARPWIQEGRLTIFSGESVVLVVGADGSLSVESVARAADILKDDEVDQLAAVFAPGGAGANATENDVYTGKIAPHLAPPPANRLRVTFRQSAAGDEMMLVIQNGFEDPVTYNAGMLTPRRDQQVWSSTSVCTVLPTILGVEHWPHPILALSLGGFHVDKGAGRDSYRCA